MSYALAKLESLVQTQDVVIQPLLDTIKTSDFSAGNPSDKLRRLGLVSEELRRLSAASRSHAEYIRDVSMHTQRTFRSHC